MVNILGLASIGFFVEWFGTVFGILIALFTSKRYKYMQGAILSIAVGIMFIMISFDILPECFKISKWYYGLIGIMAGIFVCNMIESKTCKISNDKYNMNKFSGTAVMFIIGIVIHNLPLGISLGSLLTENYVKGLHLALVIILHGIPEGLVLAVTLKQGGAKMIDTIFISVLTSLSTGIGAALSIFISNFSGDIVGLSMGFAAGLIIYIICIEIFPTSAKMQSLRKALFFNTIGIIIGLWLVFGI